MAKDFNLPSEALRNSGKLNAAATVKGSKHNKDYARHLYQMNEPYELLDAAQMASITGSTTICQGSTPQVLQYYNLQCSYEELQRPCH